MASASSCSSNKCILSFQDDRMNFNVATKKCEEVGGVLMDLDPFSYTYDELLLKVQKIDTFKTSYQDYNAWVGLKRNPISLKFQSMFSGKIIENHYSSSYSYFNPEKGKDCAYIQIRNKATTFSLYSVSCSSTGIPYAICEIPIYKEN